MLRPAAPPNGIQPPDVGAGGFWRGRTAGLPNWGWIVGGVVVGVGVLWWLNHRKTAATANSSTGQATVVDDSSGIATGQYETILSQLRDIQGQPSVPGPAGPAGPTGPTGPTGDPGTAGTPAPAQTPTTPDLSPRGVTVSVGTGANMYDFARSVYGSDYGINTLRALNPGFDTWITWSPPNAQGNKTPTLKAGRPIKT